MRAKGALVVIVMLVGLAGAWVFIVLGKTQPAQSTVAMPDGTRVQIEGTTFGTNHAFAKGSLLVRRIQTFAPGPLKQFFGTPLSASFTTADEMLILWYNRYDPATGTYPAPMLDSFRVTDEHGCLFHVHPYGGGASSPAYSVSCAYLPVFPRRQKAFQVRAQSFPVTNIEWTVENPFVTNPPAWKPEPTPATRKQGDVEFTLEKIEGHFYESGNWFETKFKISQGGIDRTEWYKPSVMLVDATGNRDQNALRPYEPAWKLKVDFYKSHKALFPEDQIWRVRNVLVPKSGEVLALNQQTNISGISLQLIALCGSGDFRFANGVCVASNEWSPTWQGGSSAL